VAARVFSCRLVVGREESGGNSWLHGNLVILFIKTKRVVCHRAVKFLRVGKGVLSLLKYVDAVVIGFICD
jgi:hypothetical protein